jgi:hypothetical protein
MDTIKSENENSVREKCRKIIKDEFFPVRGYGKFRYSKIKKAINDFQKTSKESEGVADLMLSCVEYALEFTDSYGEITEKFYDEMELVFDRALKFIKDKNLSDTFQKRIEDIVEQAENGDGSYGDVFTGMYSDYCGDD